jgi:hypothetical protein
MTAAGFARPSGFGGDGRIVIVIVIAGAGCRMARRAVVCGFAFHGKDLIKEGSVPV